MFDVCFKGAFMPVISYDDCLKLISSVLVKLDCDENTALKWAGLLTKTSLLGFDTHGISMLGRYVKFIQGGGLNISAIPTVIKEHKSCMVIDAENGFGHLAADMAADKAVIRAGEYGISMVTVRNSNHIGACGIYTKKIASNDCIGMLFANSIPGIAPWGGISSLIGINPVSVAAPLLNGSCFLMDFASSITSMGRITKYASLGIPIPQGWALDKEGNPTNDPALAKEGSLLPIAEHKGFALAMAIEILSALISGGEFSNDVCSWIKQTKEPQRNSFSIIAIDIRAFLEPGSFKSRMAQFVELIKSSPVREGFERIYYPGEKEEEIYEIRKKNGIPLDISDVQMLKELSTEFGLENILRGF